MTRRRQYQPSRRASPEPDCRTCGGSGEDVYGQRCVCTYNRARDERDRQPQPGDVFSFKDGWKCGS